MNAFRALVWKEWRDARATVLAATACAVLLSFAWHLLLPREVRDEHTAVFALVALPALFVMVLAGDLVVGDARGGRLASLRALPAAPIVSFAAKLAWLALASASFLAACFALQLPLLGADGDTRDYLRDVPGLTPTLLLAAALATGALFASTQAVGGLKAMLLSALLVGLPLVGFVALAWRSHVVPMPEHLNLYSAAFSAAALLAAAVTHCHGRLHLGARWRPALVGWGTLIACALPAATAASFTLARQGSLAPGSGFGEVAWILPSPDGRHVAVQVIASMIPCEAAVWIVDVESGEREALSGRRWMAWRWSEDGELYVNRMQASTASEHASARSLDPIAMELRRTIDDEQELHEPWDRFPAWARLERPAREGEPKRVHWTERGESEIFDSELHRAVVQHVSGVVLALTPTGGLERVDIGSERTTLVERGMESKLTFDTLSLDDRYVLARVGDAARVLDAHTGALVAGPWPDMHAQWLHPAPIGRFVLLSRDRLHETNVSGSASTLVDLESGVGTGVGALKFADAGTRPSLRRLADGHLLVLRPDEAVELLAPDGTLLRVLVSAKRAVEAPRP